MSEFFFLLWCVGQFFLICWSVKINGKIINAYLLTTLIYFGSYAYPYLYVLGITSDLFNETLFKPSSAGSASEYFLIFKTTFDVAYFFLLKKAKIPNVSILNDIGFSSYYRYFNNYLIVAIYLLCAFLFVYGSGSIERLLFPKSRFAFEYPVLVNTANILSSLIFFISLLRHYNYRKSRVIVFFGTIFVLVYPMALSGRAVILPFLMLAISSYFSSKGLSKTRLLFYTLLIIIFYINALLVRNQSLGIDNFILNIPSAIEKSPDVFMFFFSTVSGFATTTLTVSGLADGTIQSKPDPLLFLLYISPIPSVFLPTDLFIPYQSLSAHFGFDIGINSDIVSESILWFGLIGLYIVGGTVGFLCKYVDIMIIRADFKSKVMFFAYSYLILMSNIASIRASTRFVVAIITIVLAHKIIKYISRKIS